jgi:hypothetical protein
MDVLTYDRSHYNVGSLEQPPCYTLKVNSTAQPQCSITSQQNKMPDRAVQRHNALEFELWLDLMNTINKSFNYIVTSLWFYQESSISTLISWSELLQELPAS